MSKRRQIELEMALIHHRSLPHRRLDSDPELQELLELAEQIEQFQAPAPDSGFVMKLGAVLAATPAAPPEPQQSRRLGFIPLFRFWPTPSPLAVAVVLLLIFFIASSISRPGNQGGSLPPYRSGMGVQQINHRADEILAIITLPDVQPEQKRERLINEYRHLVAQAQASLPPTEAHAWFSEQRRKIVNLRGTVEDQVVEALLDTLPPASLLLATPSPPAHKSTNPQQSSATPVPGTSQQRSATPTAAQQPALPPQPNVPGDLTPTPSPTLTATAPGLLPPVSEPSQALSTVVPTAQQPSATDPAAQGPKRPTQTEVPASSTAVTLVPTKLPGPPPGVAPIPTTTPTPPATAPLPTRAPAPPIPTPLPTEAPVPPPATVPLPSEVPTPPATAPLPTRAPAPPITPSPLPTEAPVPPSATVPLPSEVPTPPATVPLPSEVPTPPATAPLPSEVPTPPATAPLPTELPPTEELPTAEIPVPTETASPTVEPPGPVETASPTAPLVPTIHEPVPTAHLPVETPTVSLPEP